MLKSIIVEDQSLAQEVLVNYIDRVDSIELCGVFASPIKALDYLKSNEVHVVFLDIHLPELSGMEFVQHLPNNIQVIFTTAFSEFALESYDLNAVDYLLKPFSFERFGTAISKLKFPEEGEVKDFIFIKANTELKKAMITDIHYLTSELDYTEIHTESTRFVVSQPLKYWKDKLGNDFCQIHKSYIINVNHIFSVKQNLVTLSSQLVLPIGRAYKKQFLELLRHLGNK